MAAREVSTSCHSTEVGRRHAPDVLTRASTQTARPCGSILGSEPLVAALLVTRKHVEPTNMTKIIHLRYCRVVSENDSFCVKFNGGEYKLSFKGKEYTEGKGFTITRIDAPLIDTDFLLWLSVYLGEDTVAPFQDVDTRFVWQRGDFPIRKQELTKFLIAAEKVKRRKWPKWKQDLFESAVLYYSSAIRSGINSMPINLGLFALSLECLGNVRYGKRDKHWTFGDRQFMAYLSARLAKPKKDITKKPKIKEFEKRLRRDIDLLNHIRNAFYGHSLLHLKEDRQRLLTQLRQWQVRSGRTKKFAELSFNISRLKNDVVRESFGLYKLGLRLNRLFLFLSLGISAKVPFASHDFHILGDLRNNEESEFRGMKSSFSFSVLPKDATGSNPKSPVSN